MLHVSTDCLYPGGDHVTVSVERRGRTLHVSDDSCGFRALLAAGMEPASRQSVTAAHAIAEQAGVEFVHGSFVVADVAPTQERAAVVHVANASQAWVLGVFNLPGKRNDLSTRIGTALRQTFGAENVAARQKVGGASTRPHQIAFMLPLQGGRAALIEPTALRSDALAATYMKFGDIKGARPDWPREVIVDDIAAWPSPDLVLLAEVATGITDLQSDLSLLRRRLLGA